MWRNFSLNIIVNAIRSIETKDSILFKNTYNLCYMHLSDRSSNGAGQIILFNKINGLIPGSSSLHPEVSVRR